MADALQLQIVWKNICQPSSLIYVHNFLLAKYSHLSGLEAIYYRYVNPLPNPLRHVWLLLPRS